MNKLFRKKTPNLLLILTASTLVLSSPKKAAAQIDMGGIGDALGKALSEAISKGAEAAAKRRVNITPLVNNINDSTKELTLELEHKGNEKITAKLSIDNSPGGGAPVQNTSNSPDSVKKKTSLFDEEENRQDTSSVAYKPMASWISGLPESITLVPGEKKKITLRVKIPVDAVAGEYAAWIATYVGASEKADAVVKMPAIAVTKLVYKK